MVCSQYTLYAILPIKSHSLVCLFSLFSEKNALFSHSIIALRKAEKEEEKRAREKIRQKVEEDKVRIEFYFSSVLL